MKEWVDGGMATAFIIFGVTGDLTSRKLVPALYQLTLDKRLPEEFHIIGFARRDWDDSVMADSLRSGVEEHTRTQPVDMDVLASMSSKMHFIRSDFDDLGGYERLNTLLETLQINNRLLYLAAPPEEYPVIIQQIGKSGLASTARGWTRISTNTTSITSPASILACRRMNGPTPTGSRGSGIILTSTARK